MATGIYCQDIPFSFHHIFYPLVCRELHCRLQCYQYSILLWNYWVGYCVSRDGYIVAGIWKKVCPLGSWPIILGCLPIHESVPIPIVRIFIFYLVLLLCIVYYPCL